MNKILKGLFSLNRPLFILLATNSSVLIAIAMLAPIWAIFIENIGGEILETGLAFSTLAITAGIVVIFMGRITDQVKNDELIVALGYAVLGIGFILYNFVNGIWFLAGVQIVVGLGMAIHGPAFDAVYSKHLEKHASGREWSAWESMNYFSQAIGAGLGAFIAASFGFNILFTIMAILCFASAAYIYFLPRRIL